MAYSAPKNDYVAGNKLTASLMNIIANCIRYLKGDTGTIDIGSAVITTSSTSVCTGLNADNLDGATWKAATTDVAASADLTITSGGWNAVSGLSVTTTGNSSIWGVALVEVNVADVGVNIEVGIGSGGTPGYPRALLNVANAGTYTVPCFLANVGADTYYLYAQKASGSSSSKILLSSALMEIRQTP